MACPALTFTGITPDVMGCCVQAAQLRGARIPYPLPDAGEVTVSSFTFTWTYDKAARTMTVRCTRKPRLVPCAVVNGTLRSTVKGCGGTPG